MEKPYLVKNPQDFLKIPRNQKQGKSENPLGLLELNETGDIKLWWSGIILGAQEGQKSRICENISVDLESLQCVMTSWAELT